MKRRVAVWLLLGWINLGWGRLPSDGTQPAQQPMSKNPSKANRLVHEKSPYLLQHAHNPVDWYPWGEEAFAEAKGEDKPIFLSIGYSTCHWCHVMERESFTDPSIAAILNEHFVAIKMDREERPDVDQLYMQAVMQMTGQGGWPLTVFLTPDLKPFHGGTYFPPEDRWGIPGLKTLLKGVAQAWEGRRDEILRSSESMTQALKSQASAEPSAGVLVTEEFLKGAYRHFAATFDESYGGFEPAPKFPRSHGLSFLLRYGKRYRDPEALKMVGETLKAMADGGMYDHLGGGFHRYSTDSQYRVPHFEKMLYDQAILARSYLEAYQATGKVEFAATAREIFEYVLRDVTDPKGGFYSAEDADSPVPGTDEKAEGTFYLWTKAELDQTLGAEAAPVVAYLYGILPAGNALIDPQGEFQGKNILYRAHTLEEAAQMFKRPVAEIEKMVEQAKRRLFEARSRRPRPHLDDKVLVDWNGLMISSLAFGSRVLEEPRYREAARSAADFILKNLVRSDPVRPELVEGRTSAQGRLLHRYRDGEAGILGTLEDYAFFVHGLVDLYEATFEPQYLAEAKRLTQEMIRLFWDDQNGGFFLTATDAEKLLVRQKELYDGAIPSGNSVAALDLLRVGRLTMAKELEEKAEALMRSFADQIAQNPSAYPQLLIALDFALGPSNEIVIAGSPQDPATQAMIRTVYDSFLPNKVVALHPPGKEGQAIEALVPFLKEQVALEGKPTAYVCQNYTCNLPISDVEALKNLLKENLKWN